MADDSGIKGIEEQDLGTVEVNPNAQNKPSAFPQFTDEAKVSRGLEDFTKFKKGFKQALPYVLQLGADLVPGSGITEISGQQIDVVEGGKRLSFPKQVERTTELAKEGKTTEAIVSGVDTALTGVAGVGEGMMVAGAIAPSIYGKALAIAGWGLYGLSKTGSAILRNTKTGKKILADFEGDDAVGYDIKSIKIPENVESDDTIKTLEDNIDIETVRTDDTDTEVAIPELAKDLNTTEAITGYIVAPDKLDRDQLVAKVENDPEVKTKTDKYLEEQGISGDTVPLYRLINVEDKVKRRIGDPFPEVIKKAEIGNESIISGSLTPKANIKTYDFFEPKVGVNTTTELVRYDVPRDRIKIAMGGFKNDIKQNVNKKLKEKGFGQEKISGLKTVTNPSKTAKELIDMQDEIIADVTGLEKTVLNKGPSFGLSYDVGAAKDIIDGKIKTIEDYKNYKGSSYYPISSEERTNFIKNKTPIEDVEKLAEKRYIDEANKITDFYGLPRLGAPKQDEGIKALEQKDITPSGFKFEPADPKSRRMYGRVYEAEDGNIALLEIGVDGYSTKRLYGVNAMVDGKPRSIGKVTLSQSTVADDKKIDDLINIELDDDVRGKGFGEKIIKGLVNYSSRPEGLSIRDIKRNALPFWKKLGINFYEGSINKGSRYKKYGFIPNESGIKNVKYKFSDELKKEQPDEGIKALGPQDIKEKGITQIPTTNLEVTPLKGLDIVQRTDETPLINKQGKIKIVDIHEYLDNPQKRDVLNQKDFDDMIQEAKEEIMYQLKQEKTGKDWYDGDIEKTMKLLEEDNPNFYAGGEKKDLLVFLTSIMSSGQNVGYDMNVALRIMDKYIETGTIYPRNPDKFYTKKEAKKYKKRGQPSIEGTPKAWTQQTNDKALSFTDAFIKDKGLTAFLDFVHAPTTRREASKLAEKYGLKPFLGRKDEPIIGANLFGDKIGNFMQNMMGMDTDANVADIWFTRMMNRRQGNMFIVPKTGKNKGKRISIDQPQSVPHREAYDRFIDVLSKEMGESKRDTQAILWYFEQGLYSKLGVPSEPKKYSEVVEGILKQRRDDAGRSVSQSNEITQQKKSTSKTSRAKTKTTKLKRAEGGFVERNTYDWVYTNG